MKLVKFVFMIGLILRNSIELTTVLPNTGVIRQALKNYKDDLLSFEAVFAYHHFVDPLSVCTEVLGKFGTDCRFVHEINFLADLPKNAFKSYDTIAYRSFSKIPLSKKATSLGSSNLNNLMSFCFPSMSQDMTKSSRCWTTAADPWYV